ncbi:MAG: exodeoxyribonuclease VII large subunit [Alphaproteobacteria bacterium]
MPETAPDFNHNQPEYTVSEVSQAVKRVLEGHFGHIRLRGEISGWRGAHSSGHAYFSLKDDKSVINAVCWKGTMARLAHKPEEGLEVIATGKISSFNGKYQIIVENIEPAGEGALMALLEKRRKMFEAEGLFAQERKKPLPYLPRTVGVITSPTGAVIRDILHRISDRFPVHVLVWPVAVQGEGAKEQVAAAIRGFNTSITHRPDVIIVARGGGSLEDLWAFNEEIVVRAAAESAIPLISAVGHETDTTLIDFVSDRRAPTPTAAAEMAVPVRDELRITLTQIETRRRSALQQLLTRRKEQLAGLARGLPKPEQLLSHATQRLDDRSERLAAALLVNLHKKHQQLAVCAASLRPQVLRQEIVRYGQAAAELQVRMNTAMPRTIARSEEKLQHITALLESVNYKKVLQRGFALVRAENKQLVTSAQEAQRQKVLSVTFADGEIMVTAK